jgi:hypothetical protein
VVHRDCVKTRGIIDSRIGVFVLDIVYLLGIITVFALVGLVAWGVQKL